MIARLTGTLAEISADGAVIDVGGVGYLVLASARTLARVRRGGSSSRSRRRAIHPNQCRPDREAGHGDQRDEQILAHQPTLEALAPTVTGAGDLAARIGLATCRANRYIKGLEGLAPLKGPWRSGFSLDKTGLWPAPYGQSIA